MGLFQRFFKGSSTVELEERLAKLEREFKNLEMEWENAYDKLHSMMGRIARRASKMHDNAEDAGQLHPAPLSASEDVPGFTLSRLTPRQRQIQAEIQRQRERVKPNGRTGGETG